MEVDVGGGGRMYWAVVRERQLQRPCRELRPRITLVLQRWYHF